MVLVCENALIELRVKIIFRRLKTGCAKASGKKKKKKNKPVDDTVGTWQLYGGTQCIAAFFHPCKQNGNNQTTY